jgi:hypothetical protein
MALWDLIQNLQITNISQLIFTSLFFLKLTPFDPFINHPKLLEVYLFVISISKAFKCY